MTAVLPQMMEELIGICMAAMARSEGHMPNMPNTDRRSIEKQRETRALKQAGMPLRDRYQKAAYQAIKRGIKNVRDISRATDIDEDAFVAPVETFKSAARLEKLALSESRVATRRFGNSSRLDQTGKVWRLVEVAGMVAICSSQNTTARGLV
jgi:hypothetical protein